MNASYTRALLVLFSAPALLVLFFSIISSPANAAPLGVNKVSMEFNNVLRGGYAEDTITVSTGSERDILLYYEVRGEISDWVRFNPADQPTSMTDGVPSYIRVIVEPPSDARIGDYTGLLVISTGPLGEVTGNMGNNVLVAFEVRLKLTITDTQILSCTAGGFDIKDSEFGFPLQFSGSLSNSGNVRIRPASLIRVFDQDQINQVTTFTYRSPSEILPTIGGVIQGSLDNSLSPGQYWAHVSVPDCGPSESLITFSVLERGGISDLGDFVRIDNKAWAIVGEIVPVTAYFRNRGSRVVSAQFKGIVSMDGKIIETLNSDIINVAPNELVPFEMFFKPKDSGQYKITGRVHYNNKITFEKGSILNVNHESGYGSSTDVWLSITLVIVIIIIGILLFLILKKKRKHRAKSFGF